MKPVAIILGCANASSIASAIVAEIASQYARVYAVYQTAKARKFVEYMEQNFKNVTLVQCDVTDPNDVENLVALVSGGDREVHLVHSIAFAPALSLKMPVHKVALDDFATAMHISVHSLIDLADRLNATGRLRRVVTISYIGAVRAMRGYGVMGVCKAALEAAVRYLAQELGTVCTVNAVSPGPIRTRAAGGIPQFDALLSRAVDNTPGFLATTKDVAAAVAFLLSDNAQVITGQTLYVDGGFSING